MYQLISERVTGQQCNVTIKWYMQNKQDEQNRALQFNLNRKLQQAKESFNMFVYIHVFVGRLEGLCSIAHDTQHFSVGRCIFKCLSLEFNCRQSPIDLLQLLFIPLLSFQCLQCSCNQIFNSSSSYSNGNYFKCQVYCKLMYRLWPLVSKMTNNLM